MCDKKSINWSLIIGVAAVVAALTTAAIFLLRSRTKRSLCACEPFDCDLDDCCGNDCFCDNSSEEAEAPSDAE